MLRTVHLVEEHDEAWEREEDERRRREEETRGGGREEEDERRAGACHLIEAEGYDGDAKPASLIDLQQAPAGEREAFGGGAGEKRLR